MEKRKIKERPVFGALGVARGLLETSDPADRKELFNTTKDWLDNSVARVKAGDLSDLESMLVEQAELLNHCFADTLAKTKVAPTLSHRAKGVEVALKAQNACRKTILAINELKNPKRSATFIKNQNNLVAGDFPNGSAKMDSKAKGITGSENPPVEAVVKEHRTKVG